jgi:hypothetical protein
MISNESNQDRILKTKLKILVIGLWVLPIFVSSFVLTFHDLQIDLNNIPFLLIESIGTAFVWLVVVLLLMIINYLVARKFVFGFDLVKMMKMFRITYISSSILIAPILGICFWKIFMRKELTDSFDTRIDVLITSTSIYFVTTLLFGEFLIRFLTYDAIKEI